MKRLPVVVIAIVLTLVIAIVGLLGYRTAAGSPGATAQPTNGLEKKTIPVEWGDVRQVLVMPGEVVPVLVQELSFPVSGPLAELAVHHGDHVTEGQRLARLGNLDELETAVATAELELTRAQQDLDAIYEDAPLETAQAQLDLANAREELRKAKFTNTVLQEGNRASSETLAAAKAKLALASAEVERAETEYSEFSGRPENDPARASVRLRLASARQRRDAALRALNWYTGHPTEIQQAIMDADVAIAEARLAIAEMAWERVKDGPDPSKLAEAELTIQVAEFALEKSKLNLASSTMTAPFSGTVLDVKAQVGEEVMANTPIIELADLTQLEVETTVGQEDVGLVQPGQSAILSFDAQPGESFPGHVSRVVPKNSEGHGVVTYPLFINLDQTLPGLLPGMTADVEIAVAERKDVLVLPRRAIRAHQDSTMSLKVLTGDLIVTRSVHIGLVGDLNAEILSGLKEGDLVVVER